MMHNNKFLKSSKEMKKNYVCKNCYIIRFFLIAVIFIILLALIQNDKLHYLDFVTPLNAATLIIILGLVMFLIKLTIYLLNKNNN